MQTTSTLTSPANITSITSEGQPLEDRMDYIHKLIEQELSWADKLGREPQVEDLYAELAWLERLYKEPNPGFLKELRAASTIEESALLFEHWGYPSASKVEAELGHHLFGFLSSEQKAGIVEYLYTREAEAVECLKAAAEASEEAAYKQMGW